MFACRVNGFEQEPGQQAEGNQQQEEVGLAALVLFSLHSS